jgi:enoyl-[acyl-carrier protein] reductase I
MIKKPKVPFWVWANAQSVGILCSPKPSGYNPFMLLEGKVGLVLNVTNKNSIGWAIADQANQHGARVGIGAQNERLAEGVNKLIEGRTGFDPFLIDFGFEEQYAMLREQVASTYGKIDFLVHSVGFAPKTALDGRFIDTTLEDFQIAMNASVYSLIRTCAVLEDLFNEDASVITLSYLGSQRAMPSYNIMGACKAALEASIRYLAMDLGEKGIRVNTLSPGPVNTISGRGVKGLSGMLATVQDRAPLKRPYGQPEVGANAMWLLSDLSKGVTGQLVFIDSGYSITAF